MTRQHRLSFAISFLGILLILFPLPIAAKGLEPTIAENPVLKKSGVLTAIPQFALDELGYSVAISGNVVVAGAPYYNSRLGAAFVYLIGENGWSDMTQVAVLTASDSSTSSYFGYSVAIDGNTIVIGAYGWNTSKGKSYVFVKPTGGWQDMSENAALTPLAPFNAGQFGFSVSISGDVIAVGANMENSSKGAVYVFSKPGSGWSGSLHEGARLTAADGASTDRLGEAVSIDGSTIAAGAIYQDVGGTSNSGAVYIFVKPGSGWVNAAQTAKLSTTDKAANDNFGKAVSIDGETLVVGADNKSTQSGAAYVFMRPGSGWSNANETVRLGYSMDELYDHFGRSVSIDGNMILVGADGKSVFMNDKRGAAFLYVKPAGGWINGMIQRDRIYTTEGINGDQFGFAVDLENGTAVAGAPLKDKLHTDNGAVYVFSPAQVYYNPDGICNGNIPCFNTFGAARAAVAVDGIVSISGMILEDLLMNKAVTVNIDGNSWVNLQGKLDIQQGTFDLTSGLRSISDLTLGASGTFTPHTNLVMLGNRGLQSIAGNFSFYDLSTDPTAMVDIGPSLLNVTHQLTNAGAIKRSAPAQVVNTGGGVVVFQDAVSGPAVEITSTGATSLGSTEMDVTMGDDPGLCNGKQLFAAYVLRHFRITPQNIGNLLADLKFYYRTADLAYSEMANLPANAKLVVYGCGVNGWQPLIDPQVQKSYPGGMYSYVEATSVQMWGAFAIGTSLSHIHLPLVVR